MAPQREQRPLQLVGIGAVILVAAVVLLLLIAYRPGQSAATPALSQSFNSTSLRFNYPQGWQYSIPDQNIVFLADAAVLGQQPGASMTIQRSLRLMTEVSTPEEALALFLQRGPMSAGRDWTLITEAEPRKVNGRAAVAAVLEGAESAGAARMHSEIIVTRVNPDSGAFYVFALSVPLEQWPQTQPVFDAILDSVTIRE
jgi:hypothetical protein